MTNASQASLLGYQLVVGRINSPNQRSPVKSFSSMEELPKSKSRP
jgi:hypothetical protein